MHQISDAIDIPPKPKYHQFRESHTTALYEHNLPNAIASPQNRTEMASRYVKYSVGYIELIVKVVCAASLI